MLAACSTSPDARYYTLQPSPATLSAASGEAAPVAGPARQAGTPPGFVLEVLPVSLPMRADQPQIMLGTAHDTLTPLYSERWASPLGEEIQSALSQAMTRRLGTTDVYALGAPGGLPVWRVQVDVQRFAMAEGEPVLLDATWRLREIHSAATLLCRSEARVAPAEQTIAGLVQAQQIAVARLALQMADAIERSGNPPAPREGMELRNCSRFDR